MEILCNDWTSKENQQSALATFDNLFKLKAILPGKSQTEGQIYRENFISKNGLYALECLQEDGCQEIYEQASAIMLDHFRDMIELDEPIEQNNNDNANQMDSYKI